MTKTFMIDTDCFIDNKLFKHYFETVPLERRKKINRLIPLASKRLSLGAGVALSVALADFGLSKHDAEIQYDKKGKPILKNNSAYISLSHSGHYAVASIASHNVGVDIEEIKPVEDGVIKRVTTKNEQEQIKNLRDFYRLWTAKECMLKITGEGLSGGMDHIDLHLGENKISIVTNPTNNDLYFKEYNVPNFCLTVCSKEDNFTEKVERITL